MVKLLEVGTIGPRLSVRIGDMRYQLHRCPQVNGCPVLGRSEPDLNVPYCFKAVYVDG